MPFVEREHYSISSKCRLHPDNDLFRDQEEHKIHFDINEWQCGYCKKSFRAEKFLDQHMDNRHHNLLNVVRGFFFLSLYVVALVHQGAMWNSYISCHLISNSVKLKLPIFHAIKAMWKVSNFVSESCRFLDMIMYSLELSLLCVIFILNIWFLLSSYGSVYITISQWMQNGSKCLADLCGALHCDHVMKTKSTKAKCNPAAVARNHHLCEVAFKY